MMKKRAALFMGLFALAFFHAAPPAFADSCFEAYVLKDYETAYRLCLPLAEKGDATAQNILGGMYFRGEGTRKDYQKAARWYRKAADQGEASAQSMLGLMYERGEGVPKDYQKALGWYRKAVDQGNRSAQFRIGKMYYEGKGVPQDYQKALHWLREAADQGLAEAQTKLDAIENTGFFSKAAHGQYEFLYIILIFAVFCYPLALGDRYFLDQQRAAQGVAGVLAQVEEIYKSPTVMLVDFFFLCLLFLYRIFGVVFPVSYGFDFGWILAIGLFLSGYVARAIWTVITTIVRTSYGYSFRSGYYSSVVVWSITHAIVWALLPITACVSIILLIPQTSWFGLVA